PPTIVPLSPPRPAPLEGTWALLPGGAEVPRRSTADPCRAAPGSLPATGAPGSCGSCAPAPGFGEPPGLPTIGPVSPPTTEPLPPPTIVPSSPPRPASLEGTWAL